MLIFLLIVVAVGIIWFVHETRQRRTRAMGGGLHVTIDLPHEQTWELYHNDFSLCSKKIRVCLDELGIAYRSHHIDLIETGSYENISRHFLKINPASLVPVLVHQGHPIYESHEQLVYASSKSDKPNGLVPESDSEKVLMDHWVHKTSIVGDDPVAGMNETIGNAVPGLTLPIFATMITAISFHKIIEGLLFHRLKQRAVFFMALKLLGPGRLPKVKPIVKVMQQSFAATRQHLNELESCLEQSNGPYIIGEQFTLADVGMMVIFDRLDEADWKTLLMTQDRPLVKAYADRLKQRPSYSSALQGHRHPTVTTGHALITELKQQNPNFSNMYAHSAK
jgi:glutathione S-transferase